MTRNRRIGLGATGTGFGVCRGRTSIGFLVPVALLIATVATAQSTREAETTISDKPLTAEQLAVYRSVLGNWMEGELSTVNLAIQTAPLASSGPFGGEECAKGLELEPAPAVIHRFRVQDLSQLGSKNVVLVDPDKQRKEVAENDPERTVRDGKSIADAVRNGFAHGLVTLSEIRFDKEHKLAIVSYGFFCGSLCGNGGTVVMEKTDAGWRRKSRCDEWIS
jgi:hypothetical protein